MKFGKVPLAEAGGAILAYAMRGEANCQTFKISKGTQLDSGHLAALAEAGIDEVTVARLAPGDVHEDAAAARLADAMAGAAEGVTLTPAATGRVNLRATGPGIAELDVAKIHAVNRIDPGITVATVPEWQRLGARGLLATVKIIPYAVAETALVEACKLGAGALRFRQPEIATATLIETQIGAETPGDKGRRATEDRLARLGVSLSQRVVVPHDTQAVADALKAAPGQLKLILTGSATSDVHDIAPSAVAAAGGRLIHFGMPVDPGNLLFVGQLNAQAVIGLPGCARAPALNGADWVLERIICGLTIGPEEIMAMGVGGLLKEIPSRPQPRAGIESDGPETVQVEDEKNGK